MLALQRLLDQFGIAAALQVVFGMQPNWRDPSTVARERKQKISRFVKRLYAIQSRQQALAIGGSVRVITNTNPQRQSGARRHRCNGSVKSCGSRSDDSGGSDGGDPDPERSQQVYTYQSIDHLLNYSAKTSRSPIHTIVGPRFTSEHLQQTVTKEETRRGRGQPRIAHKLGKGGAA